MQYSDRSYQQQHHNKVSKARKQLCQQCYRKSLAVQQGKGTTRACLTSFCIVDPCFRSAVGVALVEVAHRDLGHTDLAHTYVYSVLFAAAGPKLRELIFKIIDQDPVTSLPEITQAAGTGIGDWLLLQMIVPGPWKHHQLVGDAGTGGL